MNKIEKLIQELCPEGVEFREFRSICKFQGGHSFDSAKFNDLGLGLPVIRIGDVNSGPGGKFYDGDFPEEVLIQEGDLLISMSGDFKIKQWSYGLGLLNQRVCRLDFKDSDVLKRFIFHYLEVPLQRIHEATSMSVLKNLSNAVLGDLMIPVPPLEIQREIVSILDKFTELEAELEAELDARSNQYESYRDALFDLGPENKAHPLKSFLDRSTFEGVEWVAIGTLGVLFPGLSGKSKEDFSNGNRPFVSYLDIGNHASLPREILSKVAMDVGERQNEIRMGDILFTGSSEDKVGVGLTSEVEYEPNEPTYLNSFCFGLRPERDRFAKGFLKHVFRSSAIRNKIIACANGVTRINISKKLLLKVEVPQPPLVLQEAIVSILDKLDDIITGTQGSLPSEIQARRKQYEYYRNKLLTFKELDAA